MEDLFSTRIAVNSQPVAYRVVFENEQYTFLPESNSAASSTFSLKRENDEWHDQGSLAPEIRSQAIEALEKYLLQQH